MLLLLILPVLVAGFLACHIHPVHSYKLHRYEGQYLYLKSAELGLECFALAFALGVFSHYQLPNSLTAGCFSVNIAVSKQLSNAMMAMGTKDEDEALKLAWFFILSALTFLAAFIIKIWATIRLRLRFGTWDTKVFVIGKLLEDSPLDTTFSSTCHSKETSMSC